MATMWDRARAMRDKLQDKAKMAMASTPTERALAAARVVARRGESGVPGTNPTTATEPEGATRTGRTTSDGSHVTSRTATGAGG